jgi:hypothetical protein
MGYAIAGWSVALALLVAFAAWTIVRGRQLARRVPPERQRWL